MKFSSVLSEAIRNIASGTTFALVLLAVYCGAIALTLGAAFATQIETLQRAYEFDASGASTQIIASAGAIDGARCTALSTATGVKAALAVRYTREQIQLLSRPDRPAAVIEVAGDADRMLGIDAPLLASGVLVAEQNAELLGVREGGSLRLANGTAVPVIGLFPTPDDGRKDSLSSAVLAPVQATGDFDECWIRRWPVSTDRDELFRFLLADHADVTVFPEVRQWNARFGQSIDAVDRYAAFSRQWPTAIGYAASLLIGYVAIRMRRAQVAGWRQLGMSASDAIKLVVVETAFWSATASSIAASLGYLAGVASVRRDDVANVVSPLVCELGIAWVLVSLGAAIAALSVNPARHYRYVRDRG